jgi:hypothetical protein
MHSAAAMNYTVRACANVAGLAPGDAILGVVPLASAPGFTFTAHFALSQGHPLVIVDPWNALETLKAVDAHQCRWAICVPTHLASLVEVARSGGWDSWSPFKALAVGGSSMTPELIRDAEELLGITALRMFGMSECMGHASTRPGDPDFRRGHSDGRSFPGTRDEAFDAANRMLPRGERGQAGVKGPSLFLGYCRGLGDHEFRLTDDGYYLTGDEIVCAPCVLEGASWPTGLRQLGLDVAHPGRGPGREAVSKHPHGRRIALPPARRAGGRAPARHGSARVGSRRQAPTDPRRRRAAAHHLGPPRGQRPGEDRGSAGRPRRLGDHHGAGAGAKPRPHGAPASRVRRARRARRPRRQRAGPGSPRGGHHGGAG